MDVAELSPTRLGLRRFLSNRVAVICAAIVLMYVVLAIGAPFLAPHDPTEADLLRRLQPPAWMAGGEWAYPFGCDGLGRDILSRLIWGTRISLSIAFFVVLIGGVIGTLAGLVAGYVRGLTDTFISRIADVLLGFPTLVFAIGFMAMMGPGFINIISTMLLKEWVFSYRIVRGDTLAVSRQEYVEAARGLGANSRQIMLREILPNVLSSVLVLASFRMADVIMLEAALSFLGLGVQPPTPSWGAMVSDGRNYIIGAAWVSTIPGLAILSLVLSLNLASQGLRDAFDPRLQS